MMSGRAAQPISYMFTPSFVKIHFGAEGSTALVLDGCFPTSVSPGHDSSSRVGRLLGDVCEA